MQDLLIKYQKRLSNLKLNTNSKLWTTASHYQAPHKPLLLLCVFDMYAGGIQPVNAIKISSELKHLFSAYWNVVISDEKRQSPHSYSLPFYHLSIEEESFWHLLPVPGNEVDLSEAQKVMRLADAIRFSLAKLSSITLGARLDEPLHKLLNEEKQREELRKSIVDAYFAVEMHSLLYEQSKDNILQCRLQKFSEVRFMSGFANTELSPTKPGSLRGLPLRELTNVNTQVRRLAFFPALLGSAARQNYNYNSLALRLQSWGGERQENLKSYVNATGNVVPQQKPKKPRLPSERASHAAKRYVDFAESVGWLNQISGLYTITRTGRVLLTAQEGVAKEDNQVNFNNPFELNDVQRLFFAVELWRKDCDVLYTLLNLLSLYPTYLKKLQEQFGPAYRQHLEEKNKLLSGEREKQALRERISNIKTWTNPARYAEQFVPTRMNWLLDLGIVAISSTGRRECHLTSAGIDFKSRLPGMIALGDEWTNSGFFKSAASCFIARGKKLEKWSDTTESKQKLIDCLQAAFKQLRRPPVPKFSVSQVILFVCLTMAAGEGILIDYNDVLQTLTTPIQIDKDHVVELRRAARENESYLILNPI